MNTSPGCRIRGSDAGFGLLAAMTHQTGAVVAQARVEDKTSEIAWFAPLLVRIELAGVVWSPPTPCTPSVTTPDT